MRSAMNGPQVAPAFGDEHLETRVAVEHTGGDEGHGDLLGAVGGFDVVLDGAAPAGVVNPGTLGGVVGFGADVEAQDHPDLFHAAHSGSHSSWAKGGRPNGGAMGRKLALRPMSVARCTSAMACSTSRSGIMAVQT